MGLDKSAHREAMRRRGCSLVAPKVMLLAGSVVCELINELLADRKCWKVFTFQLLARRQNRMPQIEFSSNNGGGGGGGETITFTVIYMGRKFVNSPALSTFKRL